MVLFFSRGATVYGVQALADVVMSGEDIAKLEWLFSGAKLVDGGADAGAGVAGVYIGPRREMITPWSTNAVDITCNMGIKGIVRIEEFTEVVGDIAGGEVKYDKMLNRVYRGLDQQVFSVGEVHVEPVIYIDDIRAYNREQGLALVEVEVEYLESVAAKIGRPLTDSEVFGFSQVNSEHCRHKIFNGLFVIDGVEMPNTLFGMIRSTTAAHNGTVVSAYKDNCAFLEGSVVEQFAPARHDRPDYFGVEDFKSVISIKAETHNFPTTVEPFNGAATGTGGEIRDRIAGGKGAFPMAGTACYMTAYPRLGGGRSWERGMQERAWLYQSPSDILIKASNGASDFGNKFGQPLICGSLFTFEHQGSVSSCGANSHNPGYSYGFDKVIMLAGGIGYGKMEDSLKDEPVAGQDVVLLGGDNYRIGMGGGAVSSVATGEYANAIELNAIQRSNPEMQKRVYNAIRGISEEHNNPIVSIHDHGAGGHLNCLSELVEATGGCINVDALPVGDPTLSAKEIVGNESQERMGLVIRHEDVARLRAIAERERAPFYVVGRTTGDMQFTFVNNKTGERPIDLQLGDMFGKTPRTVMTDRTVGTVWESISYSEGEIGGYIENVLQIEAVACKDWLTNKVDRSITGRIAMQQTAGAVQLPVNDCGVIALDYQGVRGVANSLGHAPAVALVDPAAGSVMAIAESLTNLVFAPIQGGLGAVSLSANWMWPCNNEGENARLYRAVEAASQFAIELGLNIPTGKDSMSMTQKYPDGQKVLAPGTVIVTAVGEVSDVKLCAKAALENVDSQLVYVDFSSDGFELGGSSFAQTLGVVGDCVPTVRDAGYFARAFGAVQGLLSGGGVLAGHDVSAGGLIVALLEMCFPSNRVGLAVDLNPLREMDLVKLLFSERASVLLQVVDGAAAVAQLDRCGVAGQVIADVRANDRRFTVRHGCCERMTLDVDKLRDVWYKTSYELDRLQSGDELALERYSNYKGQELLYQFPEGFVGMYSGLGVVARRDAGSESSHGSGARVRAAIIREQGCNGDREMAWALYLAGFDVKDVHMTDLVSGRETLEDVNMIAFVGGFSNSDVLNSAKGWAGSFLYNPRAAAALKAFYAREDTLSLGVCNGCQLMVELGLVGDGRVKMLHNKSHKLESGFVGVSVPGAGSSFGAGSVMLSSLEGSTLGVWITHGEGRFAFADLSSGAGLGCNVVMNYAQHSYPGNPNGSDLNAAAICTPDGRHLAMMPHIERSLKPWNWPYYPLDRRADEVTPWVEAFVNARRWCEAWVSKR